MKKDVATRLRGFVDSTDRSPLATAFRIAGLPFSLLHSVVVRIYHGLYDLRIRKTIQIPCVVVSVGNLTMGGVGKSPLVAWLAGRLLESGQKPGLVSRGYKAQKQTAIRQQCEAEEETHDSLNFSQYRVLNDEAKEFQLRFPTVPYYLGQDRVVVANSLLKRHPDVNVIILDDAYQHRRIERDLNILVLDALNPFGGGRVAPSGFLREPLSATSRADIILLNRADLVAENERLTIQKKIRSYAPKAIWGELVQRPESIYRRVISDSSAERFHIIEEDYPNWRSESKTKRVVAFCGLGAPCGFRKTLESEGIKLVAFIEFPDHCVYNASELKRIIKIVAQLNADVLLTTMKDFVKFNGSEKLGVPLYALGIGVQFLSGESAFYKKVQGVF